MAFRLKRKSQWRRWIKSIAPDTYKIRVRARAYAKKVQYWWERQSGQQRRRSYINRLKKADIILAKPPVSRLSPSALAYRLFLKSQHVHTMLYVGDGKILHTTARRGVVVDRAPRKIYRNDRYTVLRQNSLSDDEREIIVSEAMQWKSKRLDFAGLLSNIPSRLLRLKKPIYMKGDDQIWCSKLIYQVFRTVNIKLVDDRRSQTITSEDLSRSPLLTPIEKSS